MLLTFVQPIQLRHVCTLLLFTMLTFVSYQKQRLPSVSSAGLIEDDLIIIDHSAFDPRLPVGL